MVIIASVVQGTKKTKRPKGANMANYRYQCANCDSYVTVAYVDAYIDTGHELWHISCPHCGQHTIKAVHHD